MNSSTFVPAVVSVVALVAAGCMGTTGGIARTDSSSSNRSTLASTSATVTNTLLEPHPAPTDNNNGTSFDPCLAYSASELKSWGVMGGSVRISGSAIPSSGAVDGLAMGGSFSSSLSIGRWTTTLTRSCLRVLKR